MTDKQKLLRLRLLQVNATLFDDEVLSVLVPGAEGEMEILANHEPILSPLKSGTLIIKRADNSRKEYSLSGGTVEVSSNRVTILI